MSDFEVPKRVSLDDLRDILKAYYIEGAHQEAVSTDAIKATADMGDKVGRQTNFLTQIELLNKEGHDRRLTDHGGDISEALMSGNESLAKSLFREALNEWEFTEKIRGFVRMKDPEPVEEDRLMEYISANANSSDKRGRQSLLDLLEWVSIVEGSEEGYTVSNTTNETKPQTEDQIEELDEKKGGVQVGGMDEVSDGQSSNVQSPIVVGPEISVRVEISPADDPEEIESAILAARSALEKDVKEKDEE